MVDRMEGIRGILKAAVKWGILKQGWKPVRGEFGIQPVREGDVVVPVFESYSEGSCCVLGYLFKFHGPVKLRDLDNLDQYNHLLTPSLTQILEHFHVSNDALWSIIDGWDHKGQPEPTCLEFKALGMELKQYADELWGQKKGEAA